MVLGLCSSCGVEKIRMKNAEFERELEELGSAEELLDYFGIPYDPAVVQVNRLHILQRFHDYIEGVEEMPPDKATLHRVYAELLDNAYRDFVRSNALTEKVFKVFHRQGSVNVDVPTYLKNKVFPICANK